MHLPVPFSTPQVSPGSKIRRTPSSPFNQHPTSQSRLASLADPSRPTRELCPINLVCYANLVCEPCFFPAPLLKGLWDKNPIFSHLTHLLFFALYRSVAALTHTSQCNYQNRNNYSERLEVFALAVWGRRKTSSDSITITTTTLYMTATITTGSEQHRPLLVYTSDSDNEESTFNSNSGKKRSKDHSGPMASKIDGKTTVVETHVGEGYRKSGDGIDGVEGRGMEMNITGEEAVDAEVLEHAIEALEKKKSAWYAYLTTADFWIVLALG